MNHEIAPLFSQREARLAALDHLPRSLWLGSMINSQGDLEPRLGALDGLRDALHAGVLPDPSSARWPHTSLGRRLYAVFVELDLPGLVADHADLADQVLASLLWHLDRIVDHVDRGDSADAAEARAVADFAEEWRERSELVKELVEVFGDSGSLFKNANWDQLRGLLMSEGWQEIVRTHRVVAALPELAALLRHLGRAEPSDKADESDQVEVEVEDLATVVRECVRVTHIPDIPGETRGVCRSGRIARMLPSQTMLLTHPRLRLVWHAHHAERSLLTYEEDERMHDVVQERVPIAQSAHRFKPKRRMERGPVLVCVDTSGSMQGGAGVIAKAIVLEAMRVAHVQRRICRIYAFGGPEEIIELELDLGVPGIERLAHFMGQGFHGGTDICGPLERVIARLEEERWHLADLLIASDGEFGATPDTAAAIARVKAQQGLRVQGVLVGDRETIGMLEVCDDVFWVRDWRRYGGFNIDSPVPTKSLTSILFPGALRSVKHAAG